MISSWPAVEYLKQKIKSYEKNQIKSLMAGMPNKNSRRKEK